MNGFPLDEICVVDLTQYVAGPYCTQVLADLGATVIKVERPGVGDVYRRQGPVFVNGESVSFLTLNRGKHSVELDLAAEGDRTQLLRLIAQADVLVENMRPGSLTKFALDYPSLARSFPRLIYCSISGFGQRGPLAQLGGYDLTIQALSGLMAMTGHPDGPPAKIPVAALDFGSGLYGVVGILAALIQREATGRGQWVTTSIIECALAWLAMHITSFLMGDQEAQPLGTRSPFFAPYEAYRTADGYLVVVGTGGRDAWGDMCRALGAEHLIDDPRFCTNSDRVRNAEALKAEIEAMFGAAPTSHWEAKLAEAGVPCAPVQRLPQVLESEQVHALRIVGELSHPQAGFIPSIRLPLQFSESRSTAEAPPPLLGSHNRDYLAGEREPSESS